MTRQHSPSCSCDTCWVARRAAVLRARKLPDDRFVRSTDEHSAYRYRTGQCRCAVCRDAQLQYRRELRRR